MDEQEYLFKMDFDCGRMGTVEGLFVAKQSDVDELVNSGQTIYFGEVLGKHSDITGPLEANEVKRVDLDAETVRKVKLVLGRTWSGYNPFDYLPEEE